VAEVVEDIQIP
jgi:hypothetical protein